MHFRVRTRVARLIQEQVVAVKWESELKKGRKKVKMKVKKAKRGTEFQSQDKDSASHIGAGGAHLPRVSGRPGTQLIIGKVLLLPIPCKAKWCHDCHPVRCNTVTINLIAPPVMHQNSMMPMSCKVMIVSYRNKADEYLKLKASLLFSTKLFLVSICLSMEAAECICFKSVPRFGSPLCLFGLPAGPSPPSPSLVFQLGMLPSQVPASIHKCAQHIGGSLTFQTLPPSPPCPP